MGGPGFRAGTGRGGPAPGLPPFSRGGRAPLPAARCAGAAVWPRRGRPDLCKNRAPRGKIKRSLSALHGSADGKAFKRKRLPCFLYFPPVAWYNALGAAASLAFSAQGKADKKIFPPGGQ